MPVRPVPPQDGEGGHVTAQPQRYNANRIRYARVNAVWPQGPLPKLDPAEAVSAVRRLYTKFAGKTFPGDFEATSGNRRTWPYYKDRGAFMRLTYRVNPDQGWRDLVHDVSHYVSRNGHNAEHARTEAAMIDHVVSSGWLDGKLKPKPKAPVDKRAKKRAALERRLKTWTTKAKRAETAIKKIRATLKRMDKAVTK